MTGKAHKKSVPLDMEKMHQIPYEKRGKIRRLARELEVSKSQVGRWVKEHQILPHTNVIHCELTQINKLQRLKFALNQLVMDSDVEKIKFSGMQNVVHIDEKWFFMTRAMKRMYKLPGETAPYRSCKSKRYIYKLMFMCAVARSLYGDDGQLIFYGKIGIFPFITKEPATRNSKNRSRGTMETKPIESITKNIIKECLVNKIIPAIKAKWPSNASKNIYIQQDNARPHITNLDPEFRAAASSDGFNIRLVCQPPNSPDTNINDLGWFRAIQSLQLDTASYNVEQLVKNVLLSFEQLTAITLNNVFLSLQFCFVEIMKVKGHNDFKLPHMKKVMLLRQERLPYILKVDEELVIECIQTLLDHDEILEYQYDIGGLMFTLGF